MIVNLIKSRQMFSLTLPNKVKGQYWLHDIDREGKMRELISIEAVKGEWVLKSNKRVSVLNADNVPVDNTILFPQGFFNLKIADDNDRVILFAESIGAGRQIFRKIMVRSADTFSIGRTMDNNFCFDNKFVSSRHAMVNECYMLCSDGFRHVITPEEIQSTFAPSNNPDVMGMKRNIVRLTELNKQREETDNISAILIKTV